MNSVNKHTRNKFLSDKDLIINWEFLWEQKKKVFSKVIETEEKIIEVDLAEEKIKKKPKCFPRCWTIGWRSNKKNKLE